MPVPVWSARIAGIAANFAYGGAVTHAGPTIEFFAGPDDVRVDWGAADPINDVPQLVSYAPNALGRFDNVFHFYPEGRFEITGTGVFDAAEPSLRFAVTSFPQDVAGVDFAGAVFGDFFAGGLGGDSFSGRGGDDFLVGLDGGDRLNGGAGNDYLYGWAGDDTMLGGSGDDGLFGDDGNDLLRAGPGFGSDALFGGVGDDRLFAGPDGGQLVGGPGRDTMVGGDGQDSFYYSETPDGSRDAILGFTPGEDRLVLTFLRETGVTMTADRLVHRPGNMSGDGPHLIYLNETGRLLVDMNGTDEGGRIELAMLAGAPVLGFGDFFF
jgi:hypothetical protein